MKKEMIFFFKHLSRFGVTDRTGQYADTARVGEYGHTESEMGNKDTETE